MFDPKPKITIEFAKSDFAYSDYSDDELRSIERLHGFKVKDSLLIPKELVNTC